MDVPRNLHYTIKYNHLAHQYQQYYGLIVIYGVIVAISDYTQKVSFESDDWQLESVIGTYTDYSHIIFDESVKVFDKNFGYEKVKNVIFYSKELTIKKLAFSILFLHFDKMHIWCPHGILNML